MTALLSIDNLRIEFQTPGGPVSVVRDMSYQVEAGETVAVVGESGSGKSVSALAVLGLIPSPPGRVAGGSIRFQDRELVNLDRESLRRIRGREIGMIFQEPMTALNPVLSLGRQLTESLRQHMGMSKRAARERAVELLTQVGIADGARRLKQYPHHLSGGMRQRVMIAMAMACKPRLIIADEPTTALDVTIQAQILALLKDLTRRAGAALVLITHNLGVVARYADRVNVMYAGRIVEQGPAAEVYRSPGHPYTVGLMNSVPRLDRPRQNALDPIPGQPPDPARLDQGCAFRWRCRFRTEACSVQPALDPVGPQHRVACWRVPAVQEVYAA